MKPAPDKGTKGLNEASSRHGKKGLNEASSRQGRKDSMKPAADREERTQ